MPTFIENMAVIKIPGGIDLSATFECGQAFRWKMVSGDAVEGVAGRHWARIAKCDGGITITPCDEALYEGFWRHYLDLDRDYPSYEDALSCDAVLTPMVASCRGMRLLNQPVWECLASFILSSNNNVKRISGLVERLCTAFGEELEGYHAFPSAEVLAGAGEQLLRQYGLGYRAAFLANTAQAVAEGFPLDSLPDIGYEAAKAELIKLHGVGEKVADCVLLFSCGYREAFPVDVWVRKAVSAYFVDSGHTLSDLRAFAIRRFGPLAGLAQQYLFHYERVCKNNVKL